MSKSSVFQSVSVTESDLPDLLSQVQTSVTNAANSAAAAATSAASVGTSASNAATEASNASNSATAAANSASAASTSASAAATSETNAATHVTTASNHATGAATSATSATTSQAAATQSETNAATSATNAANSATNASTSETNAAASATNAANSATTAATSVTNAQTEVTNATNQATAAANSATAAASSATASSTSETNAQTHANTASSHATTASTQATNAATSATNAATSETNAGTQATNAATSATTAAGSATNAATAQTAAESARDSALAAFDSFDDRYLGTKTSDPSTDNDGNTLVAGTLYFNSSTSTMMLYTGSAWVAAYVSGGSFAALSGATFTGDVTVPNLITAGNVDGRDVSVDGTKLDGIAANATAVTSLTDLSISDGTNGQVLTTNGSGSFSFADASGGGGATQDADGDTKIQVEEGTDDDTIRFDTAGSERMLITPTGNVGINTNTPYDNAWGTDGNNTELAIEGGSTGYGVIHLRGTGAGSTDTRFSMGVGDTKYYMAYDRIDGAHRMIMNTDGAIGFSTSDVGTETLTVNKVGSSSYGSIQLRRSDTDGDTNGGYISFAQRDDCSTSWVGMAGGDNATDRTIYLGGGNWGIEEATAVVLYAGAYDAGTGGATESARFASTFNMLKRATTVQASGVPLKVDSTNSNNFKQRWENNGSTVGYLGANASYSLMIGDTSANERWTISQSGAAILQTCASTNAHYRFHLDGSARNYIYCNSANEIGFLTSGGNWAFRCDNSGNVTATGNVTAYSDIRLKDDIQPIEGALERVSKLEGVEYTRKSTGKREIGFVAQSVIEHEPTLVDVMDTSTAHTDEAFSDLHVMKYQNTVALLVEAVKELKAEVAELRAGCCHGAAK